MELTNLPVDILNLLFDHLTQRDLKIVRLVCRSLHKLIRIHFPRVFLSPNKTNIDAFRGIVANDEFRAQVREIIWDDARLEYYERQKLPDFEALRLRENIRLGDMQGDSRQRKFFENFVKDIEDQTEDEDDEQTPRRKDELWGADAQDMSLEDSFDLYNQLYDDQQAIISAGEDTETLTLGLLSFPALKRLTISSETWRINRLSPRYETPFFRSLPSGFQMPQPWPWMGRDGNSDEYSEEQMEKLMLPWDDTQEEWRGYRIAIDGLLATAADQNVEEFVVDTNYELTGISYQILTSPDNTGYRKMMDLFNTVSLTKLEISLNVQTAEETAFSCFHNGLLKTALSQLTALKHLALSASLNTHDDEVWVGPESWVSLDEIIPVEIWSAKLESLKLCNFFLYGESLYDVLRAVSSLRAIWLDCISLTDTLTWRDLALRIREELVQGNGIWKPGKPSIVWRRKAGDVDHRLDSTAELDDFLHGQSTCPFTEQHPQVSNVGWVVSNWDPEDRHYMAPLG